MSILMSPPSEMPLSSCFPGCGVLFACIMIGCGSRLRVFNKADGLLQPVHELLKVFLV